MLTFFAQVWHKLIQTFVDNPVNESSPCMIQKSRGVYHAETQTYDGSPGTSQLNTPHYGEYVLYSRLVCYLHGDYTTTCRLSYMEMASRREAIMVPLHYLGSPVRIDSSTSAQRYRDHRHPAWHCNEPGESSGIRKLRIVYEYPTAFSRGHRAVVAQVRR